MHSKLLDCAGRLGAGTGSLGTARFYLLIHDRTDGRTRIFDVKRQGHPTGYAFLDPAPQAEFDPEFPTPPRAMPRAAEPLRHAGPYLGWLSLSNCEYSARLLSTLRGIAANSRASRIAQKYWASERVLGAGDRW